MGAVLHRIPVAQAAINGKHSSLSVYLLLLTVVRMLDSSKHGVVLPVREHLSETLKKCAGLRPNATRAIRVQSSRRGAVRVATATVIVRDQTKKGKCAVGLLATAPGDCGKRHVVITTVCYALVFHVRVSLKLQGMLIHSWVKGRTIRKATEVRSVT